MLAYDKQHSCTPEPPPSTTVSTCLHRWPPKGAFEPGEAGALVLGPLVASWAYLWERAYKAARTGAQLLGLTASWLLATGAVAQLPARAHATFEVRGGDTGGQWTFRALEAFLVEQSTPGAARLVAGRRLKDSWAVRHIALPDLLASAARRF